MLGSTHHTTPHHTMETQKYVPGKTLGQVISEGAKSKNSIRAGLSMAIIETVATDLLRTLKFLAINEVCG